MNCKIVNLDSIDYRRISSPVEGNTYFVLVASALHNAVLCEN